VQKRLRSHRETTLIAQRNRSCGTRLRSSLKLTIGVLLLLLLFSRSASPGVIQVSTEPELACDSQQSVCTLSLVATSRCFPSRVQGVGGGIRLYRTSSTRGILINARLIDESGRRVRETRQAGVSDLVDSVACSMRRLPQTSLLLSRHPKYGMRFPAVTRAGCPR
jgi:hypothetical protein